MKKIIRLIFGLFMIIVILIINIVRSITIHTLRFIMFLIFPKKTLEDYANRYIPEKLILFQIELYGDKIYLIYFIQFLIDFIASPLYGIRLTFAYLSNFSKQKKQDIIKEQED